MMSLPPLAPALHKALLAGTSRMPLKPDESGACAEIGEMLQAAKLATGSEANPMLLWHAMAANELWQRAGFTPASGAASVSPATSDSRICPMAAEHILSLILRGIHPELLETWLARAHTAQARLPHQFLVALLQDGMHKPLLRALIMPLLGTRGHWLVAQHPEWSRRYGSIEQDDIKAQWQHGNPIDRGQALRVLRQRNPQQARALLEADWASEAPENRAQLLACLAVGLSLDDEALLEQALDDKRKEVRSAAVTLLRSLNGSQLMQRCQQRLTALCNSERQFSLPDSCDKAMKRDGVGAQKMTGLGEKAGWLLDLMRSVAPGHWCRAWQSTPTQVLAVLASQEFNGALETGMAHAACAALQACASQENAEWYALVLSYLGRGWPKFDYAMMPELMQSFTLLPAAQQATLLLDWLERASQPDANQPRPDVALLNPAQSMLNLWSQQRSSSQPLSPTLSQAFLRHAQAKLGQYGLNSPHHYHHEAEIRQRFKQLGEWLAIDDLAYTESGWPDSTWPHWDQWQETRHKFLETLRFRHQLEASFLETPQ